MDVFPKRLCRCDMRVRHDYLIPSCGALHTEGRCREGSSLSLFPSHSLPRANAPSAPLSSVRCSSLRPFNISPCPELPQVCAFFVRRSRLFGIRVLHAVPDSCGTGFYSSHLLNGFYRASVSPPFPDRCLPLACVGFRLCIGYLAVVPLDNVDAT